MDLIHKTCKNNFTILWFQVNSLGVSLNWTAPSFINQYSRSVLEVGLKLLRILRDGPGLIVGVFYGRFHYAVLDGTTGLSRGNYVNMSFPLRRPRSVHELATKCSRTTRSTLELALKSSRDAIGMTTRCRRREFQEMDMSTGWSRGVSEVATDYSRNKNGYRYHEIKTCWHQKRTKKR